MINMNKIIIFIIAGFCSLTLMGATAWTAGVIEKQSSGSKVAAAALKNKMPTRSTAKSNRATIDLAVLGKLLQAGKAKAVSARISGNIDRFSKKGLPAALLMLGHAQLQAFHMEKRKNRKMLTQAGLNFMWVYAQFPRSKQAPEALFYAAQVNRELDQPTASTLALHEIIRQYSAGRYGEWAWKAQQELNK